MAKITKTTAKMGKRHTFSSFKERIDLIKIEPTLNLNRRVYDDTDSSHFISTLNHWSEINLSGNFTDFTYSINKEVNSLAQIIHHQEHIFQCLADRIRKNDPHSIQPLLELLTQFVHDLGSDFMTHYQETLKLLTDLALEINPNDLQNNQNSSNLLEWIFNCLTFMFKYLSRYLVDDFETTFGILLKILILANRFYLSRFCSEALSFLVKKMKQHQLLNAIEYLFEIYSLQFNDNLTFMNSLITLFSEAIKSTKQSFHSKGLMIFSLLFKSDFTVSHQIISGVLMDILRHGTTNSVEPYINVALDFLKTDSINIAHSSGLMVALVFTESGKRIKCWDVIVSLLKQFLSTNLDLYSYDSLLFCLSLCIRNCDIITLNKHFNKSQLKQILACLPPSMVFGFIDSTLELCRDKFSNLYNIEQMIDEFFRIQNNQTLELCESLSYFLLRHPTYNVVLSQEVCDVVFSNFTLSMSSQDIYWRLVLFRNSLNLNFPELDFNSFYQSLDLSQPINVDLIGVSLGYINKNYEVDVSFLLHNFEYLQTSAIFLNAFICHLCLQINMELVSGIAKNLSIDDNKLRLASIEFIIKLHEINKLNCPEIYLQMRLLEQVPLTLDNARDIQLRIRTLATAFVKMPKDETSCNIMANYLIGLLTNKFQPCWAGVFENLDKIIPTCGRYLWELINKFLSLDFRNQNKVFYSDDIVVEEPIAIESLLNDQRVNDIYTNLKLNHYLKYSHVKRSFLDHLATASTNFNYSLNLRELILKAIVQTPELVEAHYPEFSQFLIVSDLTKGWTVKERDLLINCFSKFNNLKGCDSTRVLYKKLLLLLILRALNTQKSALNVILNYKLGALNKYKDNLKNLLENSLFKDEITKFITNDSDSIIEDKDEEIVMSIVLAIFFGRVQGGTRSKSKNGKKTAIINSLPTFNQNQIISFLQLGSERIGFQDLSQTLDVDDGTLKRINGYISLLSECYHVLGHKFQDSLVSTIEPLIYSIAVAQHVLTSADSAEIVVEDEEELEEKVEEEEEEEEKQEEEEENLRINLKICKNIRQLGMKCLNQLFTLLGNYYNWKQNVDFIYNYIINPRLNKFEDENLQQPSSLLKTMVGWIKIPQIGEFLLMDDLYPVRSIISLMGNDKAKDSVISVVLTFITDCLETSISSEDYYRLLALIIENLFETLPLIIDTRNDNEIINKCINILLLLLDGDYIDNDYTRHSLIKSLTNAFDKPVQKINNSDRSKIVVSLCGLINDCSLLWDDFLPYYQLYSKGFKIFDDREVRSALVELFKIIGSKYVDYEEVADILMGLNSFSTDNKKLGEFNYQVIIDSYKRINNLTTLSTIQWLPLLNCSLYYITEEEELVIRSNATYTLNHFVDCFSEISNEEEAEPYVRLLKDVILPEIRSGLKSPVEVIRTEYINCLNHLVTYAKHLNTFEDMKVLLFNNDEESNFFKNINHIQIHRRQRAIRRVAELRNSLRPSSISHYILPLIEIYISATEEKLRNVSNEAIVSLGLLSRCVSWNQFKALLKKYVTKLKSSKPETLKTYVSVVITVSKSLFVSITAIKNNETQDVIKEFPKNPKVEIDDFIIKDVVPTLQRILNERNDETIAHRVVISEALVNLIQCISEQKIEENLPGLLTSTCQVLRSRSEDLRDAARKSLCKVVTDLGAKYFKFLLQELKGALTRGSQIHVLSFTMHSFLVAIQPNLKHGDLDESVPIIVDIIMEDIFGAAGQEKDSEGYTSKMKEVKHKKSFDSGEILNANISLTEFGEIINPVKLLLQERMSLKIQNKLDELLRRYALGLNHNEESTSQNILVLSYQINQQATKIFQDDASASDEFKKISLKSEEHFLVKLNSRVLKTEIDSTQYLYTLQKFSFELLRSAISRYETLLTVGNMKQFIPLLVQGINSSHEGLVATSMRLCNTIIKLPFDEKTNESFKTCARKALLILKDSPSTNNEVCQASLRYLATLIRHKSEINLKHTAISYVLDRIQPDLEEPQTQGLAFNFLKAVVAQHIILPEVYDVMDLVSQIMVVNHNKEIRDMARSVYFQFLMEFDQSRGKLEKHFKFLVNNLNYETPSGRQSVLELINLIVNKASQDLLTKLSSSFFIALANVLISDDSSKCKEMSSLIIENLFVHLNDLENIENMIIAWLNHSNDQLIRCGLNIYKIFINHFKFGHNKSLDTLVLKKLEDIFVTSKDQETDLDWQLVYTSLNVFIAICNDERQQIVGTNFARLWNLISDVLLYPHYWVRSKASKLIGVLLSNLEVCQFEILDLKIQTIAYRLLHQLNAPSMSEDLGNQIIKNLVLISMKWNKENTPFIQINISDNSKDVEENEAHYKLAIEFLITRASKILKQNKSLITKRTLIKLIAMVCKVIDYDTLLNFTETILLAMYEFDDDELVELSSECKSVIENKLGGIKYTEKVAKVQNIVTSRRQERKSKRAQLATTAPEIAIKRQMKKHARSREKRKRDKDSNGHYHTKKKKRL